MRRILILVTGLLMLAVLAAGCKMTVETYADAGRTVTVKHGQQFVIALGSNPTTGYSWQASYDGQMLTLVEKTYEQGEQSKGLAGVGGIELFRFEAVKAGETKLDLVYKRPWESTVAAAKSFDVIIK